MIATWCIALVFGVGLLALALWLAHRWITFVRSADVTDVQARFATAVVATLLLLAVALALQAA